MAANNYEQWRQDWRMRFLTLDPAQVVRRIPGLTCTADRLLVPYLGQCCAIRLSDGKIEAPQAWGSLSLYDEMNIYTHLWYAREDARLTGRWLPFAQLKNAGVFGPAFQKGNLQPFAATFTGHLPQLEHALQALGGRKLPTGDLGYEIDVFPAIPMEVIFWEGDDEFPAQANLLFDASAPDFIHVESVVTIASEALVHLAREAGVPLKGPAF